jgi:predicted ATP-grasp superfamily ATP-dependent carboligase
LQRPVSGALAAASMHDLPGHEIDDGDDQHGNVRRPGKRVKIFAYEHITGGGFIDSPLPRALRAEGELMLRSLVGDLAALSGVRVVTMLDHRVDLSDLPAECYVVRDAGEWRAVYAELVTTSDALWPVAPETGGALARLSSTALGAGRILLGSRLEAVHLTASKRRTAQALAEAHVAAVPTFGLDDARATTRGAWVVKPDDGCGCQDTRLHHDLDAAVLWIEAQPEPARYVAQPYVLGEAASLCALARDGSAWVLSVNRQRIAVRDDSFVFLGSVVNGLADDDGRLRRLVERVVQVVPGLWGYFGIDLVLGEHGPVVIEINPRLTTSYAGLGAALEYNPAALVLGLLDRERPFALPPFRRKRIDVDVTSLEGHA